MKNPYTKSEACRDCDRVMAEFNVLRSTLSLCSAEVSPFLDGRTLPEAVRAAIDARPDVDAYDVELYLNARNPQMRNRLVDFVNRAHARKVGG